MTHRLRTFVLAVVLGLTLATPAAAAETDTPSLLTWLAVVGGVGAGTATAAGLGAAAGAGAIYGVCPNVSVCQMTDDGKSPTAFFVVIGAVIGGALGTGLGFFGSAAVTSYVAAE